MTDLPPPRRPAPKAHDMLSELCAVGIPRLGIIGPDSRVTGSDDTDRGQGGAAKLERTTLRPKDSAEPSMRGFRLLVIGESSHTAHRLPATGEVSIGRSESADVQVQDPLMSRIHCKLQMGPEIWVLDCGSSNGTVVRGHRVPKNERAQISVGDTIEVGSTVVIVQPEFARSTPPRAPASDPASTTTETGRDDVMDRVYKLARRIAVSNINVLLLGETGVGKEVMAKRIHDLSPRAGKPFVGLNCATLNEQLFESELFGFEKGSFTGAQQTKPGLIETAHGGTVFLDEVGEMALATQAKLLRVLEARQVQRVGGLKPRDVDVRFIAATNQNLEREIEAGMFREDLYYRLNGITLVIPPLRERLARAHVHRRRLQRGRLPHATRALARGRGVDDRARLARQHPRAQERGEPRGAPGLRRRDPPRAPPDRRLQPPHRSRLGPRRRLDLERLDAGDGRRRAREPHRGRSRRAPAHHRRPRGLRRQSDARREIARHRQTHAHEPAGQARASAASQGAVGHAGRARRSAVASVGVVPNDARKVRDRWAVSANPAFIAAVRTGCMSAIWRVAAHSAVHCLKPRKVMPVIALNMRRACARLRRSRRASSP
jgi:pSer/pThr/pTyr-binding forkhead associated (FHA) protein